MIRLKRAYEPADQGDGHRVLVERLWPRGLRKEQAHFDEWLKGIAPSDALRKWFHQDADRWSEFRRRYVRELHAEPAKPVLEQLARRAKREPVTLVYGAHDTEHNSAVVLAKELERRGARVMHRPHAQQEAP